MALQLTYVIQVDGMMSSLYEKVCGCISHNGFLTRAGHRALDGAAQKREVDRTGSVSGTFPQIEMIFDEGVIDDQHRRFIQEVRST